MTVLECIEFHSKGCARYIIVMGLRFFLITYYLILEILVGVILDVHARGVKIKKKILNPDVVMMHLLQKKRFMEKYLY